MRFDNINSLLRQWCRDKGRMYGQRFAETRSQFGYLPIYAANELGFQLSALTGGDFPDFNAYKGEIYRLLRTHIDPSLHKLETKTQQYLVDQVKKEFLDYMETLSPQESGCDMPYERVILGGEAEQLVNRFFRKWDYEKNQYWYPLQDRGEGERLYLMDRYVETREGELLQLLGLPENRIYQYGESNYAVHHVLETDSLSFYGGTESVFTDKDFTWMIYCSHEQTVTFAGSIVGQVKDLFAPEKEHWNKFEWDA